MSAVARTVAAAVLVGVAVAAAVGCDAGCPEGQELTFTHYSYMWVSDGKGGGYNSPIPQYVCQVRS